MATVLSVGKYKEQKVSFPFGIQNDILYCLTAQSAAYVDSLRRNTNVY